MNHWWGMWAIVLGFGLLEGMLPANQVEAALSLQTAFNVTGTYTDNLFFGNEDKEDDFGTFLGPDILLLFENPDITIGAIYSGRVQLFANNFDESRYAQNVNIILDLPFLTRQYRGLTVSVDETMNFTPQLDEFSFTEAQSTQSTSTLSGAGGVSGVNARSTESGGTSFGGTGGTQGLVTRRASAFFNLAGVNLGYAWSPRLNPGLSYTNQYLHFFEAGFQDFLTHTGTFSLPYQVIESTSVIPSYSYRQTDFLGKSTQITAGDRQIAHNTTLGLSHSFSSSLSARISAGVSFFKQEGATEQVPGPGGTTQERTIGDKFVGRPIASAGITKTFRRGTMSLSGGQTIGGGGGLGAQATRTRTITGQVTYEFTQRMSGLVSAGWAQNDSVDGEAFDANTYRVQTGLGYSFTRWLVGNVSYARIDQRSKGTVATDVVVNQVFLGLTAVADPWFLIR